MTSKTQGTLDMGDCEDRQMSLAEDPDIWLGDLLTVPFVDGGTSYTKGFGRTTYEGDDD